MPVTKPTTCNKPNIASPIVMSLSTTIIGSQTVKYNFARPMPVELVFVVTYWGCYIVWPVLFGWAVMLCYTIIPGFA
ncbi:hypothetical protein, partial [Bradyrhizobium sp. Lot33]